MIWQLLQVGHIPSRPLVFVGGMYRGLLDWMRQDMLRANLVSRNELAMATVVDEDRIEDAVAIIAAAKLDFDAAKKRWAEEQTAVPNGSNGGTHTEGGIL